MIKNIVKKAPEKSIFTTESGNVGAFQHLTNLAGELTAKSGNKHTVERELDYADTFNGHRREFYNLYLVEIISDSPKERKRKERERDKAIGLIRRDVKAHADDWPEIRALELKLKNKRLNT